MTSSQWIDIYVILTAAMSSFLLVRSYLESHKRVFLIFTAALAVYSLYYLIHLSGLSEAHLISVWTNFLAIVLCICALLVMIRNSKPIFARFPAYLTALPLLSILFFPLVMRSLVINDLISAIFQGGCIASTFMLFSLDHFRNKYRGYFISGMVSVTIAYFYYWFILEKLINSGYWVPEILASTGFLTLSMAFYQRNNN